MDWSRSFHCVTFFLVALTCSANPWRQSNASLPIPALGDTASDPELVRARSLLTEGHVAEAERIVRDYTATHQQSPDAHYLLGLVLFRKPDPRGSLAQYTEGAKYRTPTAFDLLIVGSDYVELGDYSDADKWFSKSVEWDPKSVWGWYYLGRTKYNENRFEEAIAALQQALRLDPKHVRAEDNLGLCYQALQRADDAAEAFRQSIAWEGDTPTDAAPFTDMGAFLLERSQPEAALPYLQKAITIAPQDGRAHQQLGKAYANLNRLSEAQTELETAEKLTPANAPLHYILAQVYRKQGMSDRAKEEFARYSELSGSHSVSELPGAPQH